jgi:hypothetical protein
VSTRHYRLITLTQLYTLIQLLSLTLLTYLHTSLPNYWTDAQPARTCMATPPPPPGREERQDVPSSNPPNCTTAAEKRNPKHTQPNPPRTQKCTQPTNSHKHLSAQSSAGHKVQHATAQQITAITTGNRTTHLSQPNQPDESTCVHRDGLRTTTNKGDYSTQPTCTRMLMWGLGLCLKARQHN